MRPLCMPSATRPLPVAAWARWIVDGGCREACWSSCSRGCTGDESPATAPRSATSSVPGGTSAAEEGSPSSTGTPSGGPTSTTAAAPAEFSATAAMADVRELARGGPREATSPAYRKAARTVRAPVRGPRLPGDPRAVRGARRSVLGRSCRGRADVQRGRDAARDGPASAARRRRGPPRHRAAGTGGGGQRQWGRRAAGGGPARSRRTDPAARRAGGVRGRGAARPG